jgi:hypothetical protein
MKKEMIKKLNVEERIIESGLFYFDDGYLGSTCHGVPYYCNWDDENINEIENENDLENIVLNEKYYDYEINNWNDFFNYWFDDCNDWEIIEDGINGGNGYGKIIVDKVNKSIKIMVVPCLYSNFNSDKESDIKIFGFNYDNGELIREINKEKLNDILKDEDYYIG